MARIKIDLDALMGNSSSLEQRTADMQALIARLEGLLERINNSWDGSASEAYIAMMRGYSLKAKKMNELIETYKGYVDSTTSKFSAVDKKCASTIRNSF